MNNERELVRLQIKKEVEQTFETLVKQYFPEATEAHYSINAEYHDQDDEYYDSVLVLYTEDGKNLDLFGAWYSNGLDRTPEEDGAYYKKGVELIECLQESIDERDFAFAFGMDYNFKLGGSNK